MPDKPVKDISQYSRGLAPSIARAGLCYQCGRCSAGCPVAEAMDLRPHELVYRVNLGLWEEVCRAESVWLCAGCQTCTSRCPNGIDVAGLIDKIRQWSWKAQLTRAQRKVELFHRIFLGQIQQLGKIYEPGLLIKYKLLTGGIWRDLPLGLRMVRRGKFHWRLRRVRDRAWLRSLKSLECPAEGCTPPLVREDRLEAREKT